MPQVQTFAERRTHLQVPFVCTCFKMISQSIAIPLSPFRLKLIHAFTCGLDCVFVCCTFSLAALSFLTALLHCCCCFVSVLWPLGIIISYSRLTKHRKIFDSLERGKYGI